MNELKIEEVYFAFFRRRAERRIWPRVLSAYDDLSDLPDRLGPKLGEVLEEAWYDTREYLHVLLLQKDPQDPDLAWRVVRELEGDYSHWRGAAWLYKQAASACTSISASSKNPGLAQAAARAAEQYRAFAEAIEEMIQRMSEKESARERCKRYVLERLSHASGSPPPSR